MEVIKDIVKITSDSKDPTFSTLSELNSLYQTSFFENIFSIKLPSRFTALRILAENISKGSI
jgi:hypothetical protein